MRRTFHCGIVYENPPAANGSENELELGKLVPTNYDWGGLMGLKIKRIMCSALGSWQWKNPCGGLMKTLPMMFGVEVGRCKIS
jgi:hypothetical protein